MNKKSIIAILSLLALAIIAIILIDFLGNKAGKRGANPYYMNLDEYEEVDPSQILYREVLKVDLGDLKPGGIDMYNNIVWLATDDAILKISPEGKQLAKWDFEGKPTAIHGCGEGLLVTTVDRVNWLDMNGIQVKQATAPGDSSRFTSVTVFQGSVYVADAGQRRVHRFSMDGQYQFSFEGKRDQEDLHGFIIPSGYMDVAVNQEDELWVANTGMHALENYSEDGKLRGYWEKNETGIEGFSGCCNPSHFDIFDDGTFVTAEKAIFRIKVYKPSGEYIGVVAPPALLKGAFTPCEVAAGSDGRVYALDFDVNQIRIFEKKESE